MMVNLVRTIEIMSQLPYNATDMKRLKKQLKGCGAEKNKLKKSIADENTMIAPIHAAAMSNSFELFKLVLETKGVDANSVCKIKGLGDQDKFGVLDCTLMVSGRPNVQIIELLLDTVENPYFSSIELFPGQSIPNCINIAVYKQYVEVLDVLHSKADKILSLNPLFSFLTAIASDEKKVFKHLLSKQKHLINQCFGLENKTLLDYTIYFRKPEFCQLLVEAGGVPGMVIREKASNVTQGNKEMNQKNKAEPADDCSTKSKRPKICWNCSKSAGTVPLYKCEGCRKARYCDDQCQQEDWAVHTDYCQKKTIMREQKSQ